MKKSMSLSVKPLLEKINEIEMNYEDTEILGKLEKVQTNESIV